jgi:hypothetical protein
MNAATMPKSFEVSIEKNKCGWKSKATIKLTINGRRHPKF